LGVVVFLCCWECGDDVGEDFFGGFEFEWCGVVDVEFEDVVVFVF